MWNNRWANPSEDLCKYIIIISYKSYQVKIQGTILDLVVTVVFVYFG